MLSTGELDLKGEKIFAGDILQRKGTDELWHIQQSNFIADAYWLGQKIIEGDKYEIVGNEFENLELIKKINEKK